MYSDFLYQLKYEGFYKVEISLQCSFEGAEEFWKKMGYKLTAKKLLAPGMEYRYYSKSERPNRLPDLN